MTSPVDQGQASAVEWETSTSGWLLSSFWEPDCVELSCLSRARLRRALLTSGCGLDFVESL
jgi:hypothetical protein